jgi:hypothetical protein
MRPFPRPLATLTLVIVMACAGWSSEAMAQVGSGNLVVNLRDAIASLRPRTASGALGLMGFNATPDGSANAIEVNRGSANPGKGEAAPSLTLGQFGVGFTVDDSFPLFLEGYLGYARFDPRTLFTGSGERQLPLRWNNVAAEIGIGWDFHLTDYLILRPILNGTLGYIASDASLFGAFLRRRTEVNASRLTAVHSNVAGVGGSLMLAYYDHRPARDIDVELRYTQIWLQTVGDTLPAAQGRATAKTLSLWARYRWPTGWEAFGRPIRWVVDGSASTYLGDQREALGFSWALKVGGGIEFDVGRYEFGAFGLELSRIRLVARLFVGDRGVTGQSVGIGMSF